MPRAHASLNDDPELVGASWAAARGAVVGAAKWSIFGAVAYAAGQSFSPVFRNLTVQFKVFLYISCLTFGGVVNADQYLREHGRIMRSRKQMARDAEVWRRYEEEYRDK